MPIDLRAYVLVIAAASIGCSTFEMEFQAASDAGESPALYKDIGGRWSSEALTLCFQDDEVDVGCLGESQARLVRWEATSRATGRINDWGIEPSGPYVVTFGIRGDTGDSLSVTAKPPSPCEDQPPLSSPPCSFTLRYELSAVTDSF